MKILLAYDSIYGNTKKIADAIARGFEGKQVIMKNVSEITLNQLTGIDLLVVGSPTHGGRPSEKTKLLLKMINAGMLNKVSAAAFDTGIHPENQKTFIRFILRIFKYAAKRIAKILEDRGAHILGAETFFVHGKEGPLKEGEEERATQWAKQLISQYARHER